MIVALMHDLNTGIRQKNSRMLEYIGDGSGSKDLMINALSLITSIGCVHKMSTSTIYLFCISIM
ncbi:MAG: hypothetical protein J6T99_06320 [Oscillospiraceae bacterium]|nr:hypothetical protein [Oscillospiraceae bacterium]